MIKRANEQMNGQTNGKAPHSTGLRPLSGPLPKKATGLGTMPQRAPLGPVARPAYLMGEIGNCPGSRAQGGGLTYFSAYLNIRISHSMNYFPFFLACSPHPPALHHLPLISLPPPPSFWPFSSSPSFLPPPTHSPTQLLQIGNFLCSEWTDLMKSTIKLLVTQIIGCIGNNIHVLPG